MKNENLKVKKVWSPRLQDALANVKSIENNLDKPKVAVVHVGTNDLGKMDESEMIKWVGEIYESLHQMDIKMVYSYIPPRTDSTAK